MAESTYTYDPGAVTEPGKDRMRFELGDTMVAGGADTSALTDQEIQAALDTHPKSWKRAKLMLLESISRRFSYEVDTKTGPLWLYMQERAKVWRADYETLKKEVAAESAVLSAQAPAGNRNTNPPYFYTGMHRNERNNI